MQQTGRILIADDDPIVRHICARYLREARYLTAEAANADEILHQIAVGNFDLLILDLHFPEFEGLSLLAEIRQRNFDLPILIVSGMATVEDASQAMRLGAQGLLLKPVSGDELIEMVRSLVEQRRRVRAQDRVTALRPLLEISQRLLSERDLPRLYDLIIETAAAELRSERVSLMLIDGTMLHIVAATGLPHQVAVGQRIPIERGLAGWVARHGQPMSVVKGQLETPNPQLQHRLLNDPIVAAFSVPLQAGTRTLGVLNAAKLFDHEPFSEDDRALLTMLAAQAAIAIENARLYADVTRSEARYRALLRHASDAVMLLDARGTRMIEINLALEQMSGLARHELLALTPRELLPDLPVWPPMATEGREIETSLSGQQRRAIALSASTVTYDGQSLLMLIIRDTSERRRMAAQLLQAEKLAALGRLSASMAHEINNPLQALNGSLHVLLTHDLDAVRQRRYLEMSQEELTRLIDIVRRILDFSRTSVESMRPLMIGPLLDAVLALTESQLSDAHVSVERHWEQSLPPVQGVANHLKQVFFSLIFNAIEAMPSGGSLAIRSTVRAAPPKIISPEEGLVVGSEIEGPVVEIEFRDTGRGIAADELPKVFEPFYTTRIEGTGLGLAVSYSVIERHGGQLIVRSQLGQGSSFTIYLPALQS